MTKKQIIQKTAEHVKSELNGESSGHDWWHVYRVWKNAIQIGKSENVDMFVVELAALLHDIADWKFNKGNEDVGPQLAKKWLEKLAVNENIISHVCQIIREISFKGAGVITGVKTTESMVVQDADKLDAIGAIGISRAFAYGGKVGRPLHDPGKSPKKHKSFEDYKKNGDVSTINHFYEKLLLLKDRMNTKTAKKIAQKRHRIMEEFLKNFFNEWQGL